MVNVVWGDMPQELGLVLVPYVNRYLDILPSWCHTLEIKMETVDTDSSANMTTDYRYRVATFRVTTDFLLRTDLDREQTVVHEFAHVLGAPLVDYIDALVALLKKKDVDTAEMLSALQESGEEAATEDTTQLLWRLTEDRRHPDVDWKFV